jgi:protein CpxP
MRLKLALSAAVASLLFAAPVLAEQPAPNAQAPASQADRASRREARMLRKLERFEHRLDRAVERGRLTRQQADQFLAEARQLRDDAQAQRQAGGGQLTEDQKEQLHQRHQALREKVRAAVKATPSQGM